MMSEVLSTSTNTISPVDSMAEAPSIPADIDPIDHTESRDPRHEGVHDDRLKTDSGALVDYQWALEPATFARLRDGVGPIREAARVFDVPASSHPDERLILQLEAAGLHLDTVPRATIGRSPARIIAGRTSIQRLGEALARVADDPASGGMLIDACANPLRITEVRELNARTIACVTPRGGRQVSPTAEAIASAIRQALER